MSNTVRLRPRDFLSEADAWNRPWENDPQFHMERDEERQRYAGLSTDTRPMRMLLDGTPIPITDPSMDDDE